MRYVVVNESGLYLRRVAGADAWVQSAQLATRFAARSVAQAQLDRVSGSLHLVGRRADASALTIAAVAA